MQEVKEHHRTALLLHPTIDMAAVDSAKVPPCFEPAWQRRHNLEKPRPLRLFDDLINVDGGAAPAPTANHITRVLVFWSDHGGVRRRSDRPDDGRAVRQPVLPSGLGWTAAARHRHSDSDRAPKRPPRNRCGLSQFRSNPCKQNRSLCCEILFESNHFLWQPSRGHDPTG